MDKARKNITVTLIIFAIIATFAVAFFNTPCIAYAETEDGSGFDIGNGCDVQILYHYYIEYMSGVYFAYEVKFDRDFYSAVEDKKALIVSVKDTFVKNGFSIDVDLDNGRMTAYLSYPTLTDYYISQGYDGYEVSEKRDPTKKTLFYTEYTSSFQTVFASIKTEGKFVNRIYKACLDAGISDEKMLLSYVYGTPYGKRTITSSANIVNYSAADHMYYHRFDTTVAECDKFITIYQRVPNSSGWYMIAVIAGIVVLAVPLTVLLVRKKRRT